ncbi:MAG: di-heme oxidoredictase family protein [Bermanella sp.]
MLKFNILNKPGIARLLTFIFTGTLTACGNYSDPVAPAFSQAEWLPGGQTTVTPSNRISFDFPAANLPADQKTQFHAGKALAQQPWVKAPTITLSRDGLGPLYNARTCLACHVNGGKGDIPTDPNIPVFSSLIKLSLPGQDKQHGVIAHPVYGEQIQGQSTSLAHQLRHLPSAKSLAKNVEPEAYVHIKWQQKTFNYPDQTKIILKSPTPIFKNLGYGEINDDTLIGIRTAPSIHGMGLIELIPQAQISALSDEQDKNVDGISGRTNQVWDVETQSTVAGRFGLKANKPTLLMTVAGAFANDLGISNPLFKNQPCTSAQATCLSAATGNNENGVELNQAQLDLVVDFNRNLAPLKARNLDSQIALEGRELFYKTGCNQCHNPSFKTQKSERLPHLSNQIIWPYSDFLLHDLGRELADNRPDFKASGSEWRTPPLWGIGLHDKVNGSQALLHDGRASTIEEAILWHGGEAQFIKNAFINLNKKERESLILFVNSI